MAHRMPFPIVPPKPARLTRSPAFFATDNIPMTDITYPKYIPGKTDITDQLNTIVTSVHHNMKSPPPPVKAIPKIPAAIAAIPSPPSIPPKGVYSNRKPMGKSTSMVRGNPPLVSAITVLPISQYKAKIAQKNHLNNRRGYVQPDGSFSHHKRIREVMHQKTVLESMLLEHRKLQRDRQTIANDIQRMRNDLDKIREKLDVSLKALNSQKTVYGNSYKNLRKPSLQAAAMQRLSTGARSTISRPPVVQSKPKITTQKRTARKPATKNYMQRKIIIHSNA